MADLPSIFRRRLIALAEDGRVVAGVEDTQHHYRVVVEHDGRRLSAVQGQALRVPFNTCAGALARLQDLVGLPIGSGASDPGPAARLHGLEPAQHCTHLLELALFAAAQAARGGYRQYDIVIPERTDWTPFEVEQGQVCPKPIEGRTSAELSRNGRPVLSWQIDGETIHGDGFDGIAVRDAARWVRAQGGDDDLNEAVRFLRRGIHVATGSMVPWHLLPRASNMARVSAGACHVYQPERIAQGERDPHSRRDFSASADALLADLVRPLPPAAGASTSTPPPP
jgi:hypothetical protein